MMFSAKLRRMYQFLHIVLKNNQRFFWWAFLNQSLVTYWEQLLKKSCQKLDEVSTQLYSGFAGDQLETICSSPVRSTETSCLIFYSLVVLAFPMVLSMNAKISKETTSSGSVLDYIKLEKFTGWFPEESWGHYQE